MHLCQIFDSRKELGALFHVVAAVTTPTKLSSWCRSGNDIAIGTYWQHQFPHQISAAASFLSFLGILESYSLVFPMILRDSDPVNHSFFA